MGKLLGTSKSDAGQASMAEAVAMARDQAKKTEALKITPKEEQQIKYLVQQIYNPSPGEIPDLNKAQQMLAQIPGGERMLEDLYANYQDLASKGGLSPEQRNVFDQLQGQAAAQTKAQLTSIDQQMAERGTESSGLSAALKAQSVQQQAMRSQAEARDMAAKSAEAQRAVMGQQGQIAGQLGGLQQQRQSGLSGIEQTKAQQLAEYEKMKRVARQAQEEERVAVGNKQQEFDSSLSRQAFEDEFRKRQLASGISAQASNTLMQQGAAQAQAAQASSAGKQALFGSLIGAGGTVAGAYLGGPAGAAAGGAAARGATGAAAADGGIFADGGLSNRTSLSDLKEYVDSESQENNEKLKSPQIKKNAVSGMANQKKDLEYSPKLDAKEQIAQFNRTNFRGNAYNFGGVNMMDLGGAGGSIPEVAKIAEEAKPMSLADLRMKDEEVLKANPELLETPEDKALKEVNVNDLKKRAMSAVSNFGGDIVDSAKSGLRASNSFYNDMINQNQGQNALFQQAMQMQPQKAVYADGGVGEDPSSYKDVLDKNQPEIEGVDQDNIEDLISGLNNFKPEEVEQKLNEFKAEVKAKIPEEQFNQLSEYFDSVMQKRQPAAVPEVEPEIGEFPTEDTYEQGGLYEDGGMSHMAYKDGGEGTIIPGESYAGDKLPDRINSGEAVINIEQQQRLLDLLKELKGKRVDQMADDGDVKVNRDAQDKFMAIARGQAEPEHIEDDENIVEARGMKKLLGMLGRK